MTQVLRSRINLCNMIRSMMKKKYRSFLSTSAETRTRRFANPDASVAGTAKNTASFRVSFVNVHQSPSSSWYASCALSPHRPVAASVRTARCLRLFVCLRVRWFTVSLGNQPRLDIRRLFSYPIKRLRFYVRWKKYGRSNTSQKYCVQLDLLGRLRHNRNDLFVLFKEMREIINT